MKTYHFLTQLTQCDFVEEIWLFGSRARHDESARSDFDIAIICPKASDADWHKILTIIDNADTLLKVDCIRFDKLDNNDKLKKNIIRFKKVLYAKKENIMSKMLWQDYFENLGNALERLNEVLMLPDIETTDYLQDAAIQRFEFVFELYWKVLKKFLAYEKIEVFTPREVLKASFQSNIINDESLWLGMMDDRNSTSHVYRQEDARRVFQSIKQHYPILKSTYVLLQKRFSEMS